MLPVALERDQLVLGVSPTMPVAVACTSTGVCGNDFARSAEVSTNASAPSAGRSMSSMHSGSRIIRAS